MWYIYLLNTHRAPPRVYVLETSRGAASKLVPAGLGLGHGVGRLLDRPCLFDHKSQCEHRTAQIVFQQPIVFFFPPFFFKGIRQLIFL